MLWAVCVDRIRNRCLEKSSISALTAKEEITKKDYWATLAEVRRHGRYWGIVHTWFFLRGWRQQKCLKSNLYSNEELQFARIVVPIKAAFYQCHFKSKSQINEQTLAWGSQRQAQTRAVEARLAPKRRWILSGFKRCWWASLRSLNEEQRHDDFRYLSNEETVPQLQVSLQPKFRA